MPPAVRNHSEIGQWVARQLGLRSKARPDPALPDPALPDALAFIADHHGLPAGGADRATANTASDMVALSFQALSLGLNSRIVRLEAASLDRLQLPCLVQHQQLGWMPLVAVHEDQVTVQHPQQGRINLQFDAWAMEFKGLALEFRRAT
ncbi:MAG TPA: cysteine peptidase family C39 domain-containing protein [Burkholderiaceae bacterium]|nr:cysteine peptidase family C39 domain-containing protein [Burkholderiaceae bacterium]